MNNLDKKSALSKSMVGILMNEINGTSSDKSIKVIVIAETGNILL